jgi:membrane protein insertase Oxa1/YidC/SpoIIIJ
MLFRIITWIIVIGFVYRILSRFIFPVVRITSTTNDRLRQMQEQMNEMNKKMAEKPQKNKVQKEGDYIDYEELK